jgi:hypothetical protein
MDFERRDDFEIASRFFLVVMMDPGRSDMVFIADALWGVLGG